VFGRRATAGQIVHRDTFGPDNRHQGIVTVYSGAGPINAFSDTLVEGVARTFTGEMMDGTPGAGLHRQLKTGTQPDTALTSPSIGSSLATWSSAYKLSGKACSMITLTQNSKMTSWPVGEPKILQVIQGLKSWDPRLDSTWPGGSGSCRLATPSTWVYSTNPIIHALQWAIGLRENGILVGGIGASVDAIDVDGLIAAANVADTNSWTGAAVAYSLDDKFQVYSAMLQAGGAIPARKAGKISCISRGASPSSVVTISATDTAGPFEFQAGSPRQGRINTAIPRCVSESHDWEMVDLSPVYSSTYITEDGGATRSRGVDYAYVSNANQAAQLARYDIADSREAITGTIPLKPYMRDLAPGDAFTITDDGLAMSGQKCLVISRSYDPKSDVVQVTFRSETSSKHAWALAGTGTLPPTPSLGTIDPLTVATPSASDWAITPGTMETPSIALSGAVPSTVLASKVIVEYKPSAGSTWLPAGEFEADSTEISIPGLPGGVAHDVAVTYKNTFDVPGARLSLGPVTTPTAVITDQGDLATSTLTEDEVRGRYLGQYSGDAAAASAGLQNGDVYIDTSVTPYALKVKSGGVVVEADTRGFYVQDASQQDINSGTLTTKVSYDLTGLSTDSFVTVWPIFLIELTPGRTRRTGGSVDPGGTYEIHQKITGDSDANSILISSGTWGAVSIGGGGPTDAYIESFVIDGFDQQRGCGQPSRRLFVKNSSTTFQLRLNKTGTETLADVLVGLRIQIERNTV
jgi:hypothetical protein